MRLAICFLIIVLGLGNYSLQPSWGKVFEVISPRHYKQLLKLQEDEKTINFIKKTTYIALGDNKNFEKIRKIINDNGKIIYSDKGTGYIHFQAQASLVLDIMPNFQMLAINEYPHYYFHKIKDGPKSRNSSLRRSSLYPAQVMNNHKLRDKFFKEYGKKLDGSNVTVAVVDTGIDLSRTDVFQDRIVALRSLRKCDRAKLAKAIEIEIDGKKYLRSLVDGIEIKILKSKRLSENRDYYLGYFSEGQFARAYPPDYRNYDFDQDGQIKAIYPIVVFKDKIFKAYINVDDLMVHPTFGDQSIENEKLLLDFNWAKKNKSDFYNYEKKAYKYSTRLDISKDDQNRDRGLMNMAITLEPSFELSTDGQQLKEENGYFYVGLVGVDFSGHGTHCAALAAGNFEKAPQFSSPASQSKIIGISLIGANSERYSFLDTILKLIKEHKNIIFNFSFGSEDPYNDTQSKEAQIFDKIAKTYHTAFVKAAGNEGPGIKSHGTTISEQMISVVNYYSTNSRLTHGVGGSFPNGKFYLENSSSRGPMTDGLYKPDIGAPGWALSALPLGTPIGASGPRSYKYWSGTSMAAPNMVQSLALLYDATIKSGLAKASKKVNDVTLPPLSIDKVHKAIKNSALPYSNYQYLESKEDKVKKYRWFEGGAGRVNSLGAFKVIKEIINDPITFYKTSCKSHLDGYYQESKGHFSINHFHPFIDFFVSFDNNFSIDNLLSNQTIVLKIDETIDWLTFDPNFQEKERLIDLFGEEKSSVRVYLNKEKLVRNNKLKEGIHSAIIKGYDLKEDRLFNFIFPITLVGLHNTTDDHLAVSGFIPASQSINYFIPHKGRNGLTIIDLNVNQEIQGDLKMQVFFKGQEIPYNELHSTSPWAISSPFYGEGRSHVRYLLNNREPGIYEITLSSDIFANFIYKEQRGSYFNLKTSEISFNDPQIDIHYGDRFTHLVVNNLKNQGSLIRIGDVKLSYQAQKFKKMYPIKDQQVIEIPISIDENIQRLKIKTSYPGFLKDVDIDLKLQDENGQVVDMSANIDSEEEINYSVLLNPSKKYTIVIHGYNIPTKPVDMALDFNLSITKYLSDKQKVPLGNKLLGPTPEIVLKKDFRYPAKRSYSFKTVFDNHLITNVPIDDDYTPLINLQISARYSNLENKIPILSRSKPFKL